MADREKVIKGLEHCIPDPNKSLSERMGENERRHAECPYGGKEYEHGMGCFWSLMSDALELLKGQEAVEPITMQRIDGNFSFFVPYFLCGNCRYELVGKDVMFCHHCGKAVKWE